MEGISDIRVSGIDEQRPPQIQKEPYINLFFKLNHKAPVKWCEGFNQLFSKADYSVKIEPAAGLFIETWVRKPEEIDAALAGLKEAVTTCTLEYIARIQAEAEAVTNLDHASDDQGEQGRLNKIIADLNFDD
jgi:hypothetical protein